MKLFRIIVFPLVFTAFLFSQDLSPIEKLYDDVSVARIDITINPAAIQYMYANPYSDSLHQASFKFSNRFITDSLDMVGFRIRGNTSRNSKKKSFKISFNDFVPGRNFYSVDKLNLNGEHNDPSIIRSKLSFDHFRNVGVPASRASHAGLYINGKYYGLYVSVEHIDDEFIQKSFEDDKGYLWKCLYGADLRYQGLNQQTYKNLNNGGTPVYELMTNKETGDFSQLVRLINVVNNTPASFFADSLEKIFDVRRFLQYLAMNVLVGGWDDYWSLTNNYYLYYIPSQDRFTFIPYDYDNTFGVDWFNQNWSESNPYNKHKIVGGSRPLVDRILAVSQYRNLYTHFIELFRAKTFSLPLWDARLDSLRSRIATYALNDSFRTLDYGFNTNDFFNSYNATPYSNQHVKFGLRQFVNLRNNSITGQLQYLSAPPYVYDIRPATVTPRPGDSVRIDVSAFSASAITQIEVRFTRTGSSSPEVYTMAYNPVPGIAVPEDADRYTAVLPPLGPSGSGSFVVYIENNLGMSQTYPRAVPVKIKAGPAATNTIVVNELMALNTSTITDPAGEYDDWLELYNTTDNPIPLAGKYLSDNPSNLTKWKFPPDAGSIPARGYMIVWCDEDSGQVGIHTNFKLSGLGEFISLLGEDGSTVIDSFTYGAQKSDTSYGRVQDGAVNFSFMSATPGSSNSVTSVQENQLSPAGFSLSAYPNPFNPSVSLQYTLTERRLTAVNVYDITGRLVKQVLRDVQEPGVYTIVYEPSPEISGGVFFIELRSGDKRNVQKVVYLR